MSEWTPIAREYNPLAAGSIDGTDTEPHDWAVWRAMNAHYVPPDIDSVPEHTLFVGSLPRSVNEDKLRETFSQFGILEHVVLIRDIVTGFSQGYGFIEFKYKEDAVFAYRECNKLEIRGCPVIVDWEAGHRMKGWIPRRLGGGWGGRKEAGQLRFGCRDRVWRKPIVLKTQDSAERQHEEAGVSEARRRHTDSHRVRNYREHKESVRSADTKTDRSRKAQRHSDGYQYKSRYHEYRRGDQSQERKNRY